MYCVHILRPRAVYLHVPFCHRRCGYCDFTLVANRADLIESYLRGVELELEQWRKSRNENFPLEVDSIFFGGGTPSYLPADEFTRLCQLLRRCFVPGPQCEWSLEANPEDLEETRISAWVQAGVNRVSLGVQSFHPQHLQTLERVHSAADVAAVVDKLRPHIDNISFDLIFGVPGQSLQDWQETVNQAIALKPRHLSAYGLTFEKGTAFWKRRRTGILQPVGDELERAMYAWTMDELPRRGYSQYEISNYAQSGFACAHNETYWRGAGYFAFGPGAASFENGVRRLNHRSVASWLKRVHAGQSPIVEEEQLDPRASAGEAVMLSLRRNVGVNLPEFQDDYGFHPRELAGEEYSRMLDCGWIEETSDCLRLTREGRFVADTVVTAFLS